MGTKVHVESIVSEMGARLITRLRTKMEAWILQPLWAELITGISTLTTKVRFELVLGTSVRLKLIFISSLFFSTKI